MTACLLIFRSAPHYLDARYSRIKSGSRFVLSASVAHVCVLLALDFRFTPLYTSSE